MRHFSIHSIVFSVSAFAVACGPSVPSTTIDIPGESESESDTEGALVNQPTTTNITTETDSMSETDGGFSTDTDGNGDVLPNNCLLHPYMDNHGYIHQCEGYIGAELGALGKKIPVYATFGKDEPNDSYRRPKVMACCSPYDDQSSWSKQPHKYACWYDAMQQVCITIALTLEDYAADLPVNYANQLQNLANWFGTLEPCMKGLFDESPLGKIDPNNPDAGANFLKDYTWNIPEDKKWPDLKDAYVFIDFAEMLGAYLPEDEKEWAECISGDDNNEMIIYTPVVNPLMNPKPFVLDSGHANLMGPEYFGLNVRGSAEFSSEKSNCSSWCSSFVLSENSQDHTWMLDFMEFHAEKPAMIEYELNSAEIDSFEIKLISQPGGKMKNDQYEILPGQAEFMLSGYIQQRLYILPATNVTPILIKRGRTTWQTLPFTLQYLDTNKDSWNIQIQASTWTPSATP